MKHVKIIDLKIKSSKLKKQNILEMHTQYRGVILIEFKNILKGKSN
jgi:hypothetical protein